MFGFEFLAIVNIDTKQLLLKLIDADVRILNPKAIFFLNFQ
jgi:hypothetical protein